jgi:hypothetical protein
MPPTTPIAPGAAAAPIQTLLGWTFWGAFVVCLVGLAVQGGKMAIANRRGEEFEGGGLAKVFLAAVILTFGGGLITSLVGGG